MDKELGMYSSTRYFLFCLKKKKKEVYPEFVLNEVYSILIEVIRKTKCVTLQVYRMCRFTFTSIERKPFCIGNNCAALNNMSDLVE